MRKIGQHQQGPGRCRGAGPRRGRLRQRQQQQPGDLGRRRAARLRATEAPAARRPRPPRPRASPAATLEPVKLQLQWFTQAQFAGYFAALEKGFYRDEGLDVQILEGGVDIVPQTVLAQDNADFAIAWVPKALAVARAGRRHHRHRPDLPAVRHLPGVEAADTASPTRPALKGKKVGNWGFGNEFELFAGMTEGRARPGQGRHARPAAVRHAGAAQG